MPFDPPDPDMPSGVLTALKAMTYDSQNQVFTSGGIEYYLFVEKSTGFGVRWNYATASDGLPALRAVTLQSTADVIAGGTRNQNGTIAYGSKNWLISVELNDNSGLLEAVAVEV